MFFCLPETFFIEGNPAFFVFVTANCLLWLCNWFLLNMKCGSLKFLLVTAVCPWSWVFKISGVFNSIKFQKQEHKIYRFIPVPKVKQRTKFSPQIVDLFFINKVQKLDNYSYVSIKPFKMGSRFRSTNYITLWNTCISHLICKLWCTSITATGWQCTDNIERTKKRSLYTNNNDETDGVETY